MPKSRSTSQAIRSRRKNVARPGDLAHLPVGAGAVVAAVEVAGRVEVVLGLARVGDLAPDPREPEDAHGVAFVGVADQIELAGAEDEVVGIDLAIRDLVALHRVVGELDRLAARDRGLDLRQPLGELAASRRGQSAMSIGASSSSERALPPPRDLLEREPQRLGVGELAIEQRRAVRSAASSPSVNSIAGR